MATHEKRINMTGHQGNANDNIGVFLITTRMAIIQKKEGRNETSIDKEVEKLEPSTGFLSR